MAPDLKKRLHIKLTVIIVNIAMVCAVALPAQARINDQSGLPSSPINDANLKQITGRGISINFSTEPTHPVVLLWDELGNAKNLSSNDIQMNAGVDNSQTQTLILTQPGGGQ